MSPDITAHFQKPPSPPPARTTLLREKPEPPPPREPAPLSEIYDDGQSAQPKSWIHDEGDDRKTMTSLTLIHSKQLDKKTLT